MEIKLTKDQYENLIKMLYVSNWMMCSVRSGKDIKKYEDLENYIYSFAKEAGLEKYIEYDEKEKEYFPAEALEHDKEIEKIIEDYDEDTFWLKLIDRLATRDFIDKHGLEAIRIMNIEEAIIKKKAFIKKYEDEFEKSGVVNLVVKK